MKPRSRLEPPTPTRRTYQFTIDPSAGLQDSSIFVVFNIGNLPPPVRWDSTPSISSVAPGRMMR
jgi:hypothetical protein